MDDIMQVFPLIIIGCMALATCVLVVVNFRRREPKPMMAESCPWVVGLSVPGVLAFLAGMGLLFYDQTKYHTVGLILFGAGLLAAGASILLNSLVAKRRRSAWPVVQARCVKRQLDNNSTNDAHAWSWRLVCEVNFSGKKYLLTPKVRWSDAGQSEWPFGSEAKARAFLERAIAPDGVCKVRINPQNPQEGELLD